MTTDGTGYNPTMGATYGQMATYLSARSGLDYHVALNWLRAEGSQQRGNPLGVNYTAAHGPTYYSSWQKGLDAAVALLNRSSAYSRIIAAIRGNSPAAERAAIVTSPWSGSSHYANGAHFSTAGIPGAGGSSSPDMVPAAYRTPIGAGDPGAASAGSDFFAAWQAKLASIGVPNDPNHVITHAEAVRIVDILYKGQVMDRDPMIASFEGQTVLSASHPESVNKDPVTATAEAIAALPGALAGVFMPILAGVAVLAVVGVLGWSGTKDLLGD